MEFGNLFSTAQGVIKTIERSSTVKLVDIKKETDEIVTKKCVEALETVLFDLRLPQDELRKLNLLLLLNTDFPVMEHFENDCNYWHLIGCLPRLSPFFYFKIASKPEYQFSVGEITIYSPEFLSIELLRSMYDFVSVLHIDVAFPFFHMILESLFLKIVYIITEEKDSVVIQEFVKMYKKFLSIDFTKFIDGLPNIDEKYRYYGFLTRRCLTILNNSITYMMNSPDKQVIDIYDFKTEYDYSKWGVCLNPMNWSTHILSLLVSKCSAIVMEISVDMYMSWCEVDLEECVDKSLQRAIREVAFQCRASINSVVHLQEELSGLKSLQLYLDNIAVQPMTEDEEIKKADPETIVMNLLNPKRTQVKWLRGLICVPGIFQSQKYLKIIQENIQLFDLATAQILIQSFYDFLSTSTPDVENAKNFVFECINALPLAVKIELLKFKLDKYEFSPFMLKENFDDEFQIYLNKVVATEDNADEVCNEVVVYALQDHRKVVTLFLMHTVKGNLKINLVTDICRRIGPLSRGGHENLFLLTMVEIMSFVDLSVAVNRDRYMLLLSELWTEGLLDGDKFFTTHVLLAFEESVSAKNMDKVTFYLAALKVYVSGGKTPENCVTLLAFLGKTLDRIRPSVTNFSKKRMSATESLVNLVRCLSQKISFLKGKEDEELSWLRSVCENLNPLTRIHINPLWSCLGVAAPPLPSWAMLGLGIGQRLSAMGPERKQAVTAITKVLPTLTLTEWMMLGAMDTASSELSVAVCAAVTDSILVFLQLPYFLQNLHIVEYVLANFSQFIYTKVLPKFQSGPLEEVEQLKKTLTHLADNLPDGLEEFSIPSFQLLLQMLVEQTGKPTTLPSQPDKNINCGS